MKKMLVRPTTITPDQVYLLYKLYGDKIDWDDLYVHLMTRRWYESAQAIDMIKNNHTRVKLWDSLIKYRDNTEFLKNIDIIEM